MPDYPALIFTDYGPEAIARGHGLHLGQIEAAEREVLGELGDHETRVITEVNFHFVPRIKWCSKLGGFGCDEEGEWHGHWTEVQPALGDTHTKFTLIRQVTDRENGDSETS